MSMTLRTTVLGGERERYSSGFVLRGESLVIRQGCNAVSKLETRNSKRTNERTHSPGSAIGRK